MTHAIKYREKGGRAWWFATSKGEPTRLRIHAARYTRDDAMALAASDARLNPGLEFKVVKL